MNAVKDFHDTFGLSYNDSPTVSLEKKIIELRYNLMKEENEEYIEAARKNDIIEVADALGDMLYILCGTIIEHGMSDIIEDIFDEIQKSNMSKLGADGKPIYREDGKVMKGPNYFKPNFSKFFSWFCISNFQTRWKYCIGCYLIFLLENSILNFSQN